MVWYTDRGSLLFGAHGSVLFGTCIYSSIETLLSETSHSYGLLKVSLYFYFICNSITPGLVINQLGDLCDEMKRRSSKLKDLFIDTD